MSNVVPETDNINVALAAIAWEIVRSSARPGQEHEGEDTLARLSSEFNRVYKALKSGKDLSSQPEEE